MWWYTQVIFVKEGQEDVFNAFEAHVLPLLQRHNGQLHYRVRPDKSSVIETRLGYPYEIHLVSFAAVSASSPSSGTQSTKYTWSHSPTGKISRPTYRTPKGSSTCP